MSFAYKLRVLRRFDAEADALLDRFRDLGPTYLLGGALRDWAFDRAPRDYDLVVDTTGAELDAALPGDHARTRFGGHVLYTSAGTKFDVWALADTHAFGPDGGLGPPATCERLVLCPLISADAIAMDIASCALWDKGFFDTCLHGEVHLVNPHVLRPTYYFVKTLGLLDRHGWRPSAALRNWLRTHYPHDPAKRSEVDARLAQHFGVPPERRRALLQEFE